MKLKEAVATIPDGSPFDILVFLHNEGIDLTKCTDSVSNCPIAAYLYQKFGFKVTVSGPGIREDKPLGEWVGNTYDLAHFIAVWDISRQRNSSAEYRRAENFFNPWSKK